MQFAGYQTSFCDYPGKICGTIFTRACNLNCYFCHNRATTLEGDACIPEPMLMDMLQKRKGLLDGICVSGGEPTINGKELLEFLQKIRKEFPRFLIKLDTNGTNPGIIEKAIDRNLLDFVSMDIKAPIGEYHRIDGCGYVNPLTLKKSVEIIKNAGIGYNFRTTLIPELTETDIQQIKNYLGEGTNHIVQQYREVKKQTVA